MVMNITKLISCRSIILDGSGSAKQIPFVSFCHGNGIPFWGCSSPGLLQLRFMTKGRNVQDRSKKKRVFYLERTTERWKVASKVIFLLELLRNEPEQVIPIRSLEQYRQQINITRPHKILDFVRKSPKLFELYKDKKGTVWCGLTRLSEELLEEEVRLQEEHSHKAVEYVARFLMMSVDKRLRVDKIAHFRRDLGIPCNFRTEWIHRYPEIFKVIKSAGMEYLELVSWNPDWAITELEKKSQSTVTETGILDLSFPLKFPPKFQEDLQNRGTLEHFQKLPYLSPYADARDLQPGSPEFDKRAVAVMHEILSFTMEKRLVTDHLTHFRREFVMPQKLMRLLLKHFGIFYVSERGKRVHVFLTEAYEGSELIDKCPLVLWKEKILSLTGYRGRRKNIGMFDRSNDNEGYDILGDDNEDEMDVMHSSDSEVISSMEDSLFMDDSVMELPELLDVSLHGHEAN